MKNSQFQNRQFPTKSNLRCSFNIPLLINSTEHEILITEVYISDSFFRLNSLIDDDTTMIDFASHSEFSFTLGEKFDESFHPPVKFNVDPRMKGAIIPTLFLPEPVFKEEFVHHLRRLGVENFDDYDTQILTNKKKSTYILGYRAVNIIGLIFCADLAKSQYELYEDMYFFDRLVINSKKVPSGIDIFRLGEAHEFIIVSKKLADQIDLKSFTDISLIPIESGRS